MAQLILKEHDPKEIMKVGKCVTEFPEWKTKEVPTMAAILKMKFNQNLQLKDKLCKIKGHIYEATLHPVYGCGFTLAQSSQIKNDNVNAGNKLGEELEKLLDNYLKDGQ